MLLLTSPSDSLQLVTNTAAQINVHATFIDTAGTTITPGRLNTQIAAAATTTVVAAPPTATQRNIKSLHVRNLDPTLTCTVTLQLIDSVGALALYLATLTAGQMIELVDMGGLKGPA